jgi:hypothetical protein
MPLELVLTVKSVIRWQERIIEVLILLKLTEQCRSLSGYRLLIIVGWLLSILAPASLPVLADSDDDPLTEVLQILYTNDIESVYAPLPALWRDDMAYIGGLPKLGTLINKNVLSKSKRLYSMRVICSRVHCQKRLKGAWLLISMV